jgi:putative addiction module component (TIGR02574 family)
MSGKSILEEARQLNAAERADIATELWRTLEAEAHDLELSMDQFRELLRRQQDHTANPGNVVPWNSVRAKMASKPE